MNKAMIRRWINEYLDGEIGLADKAELEQFMAENPEIREEYKALRKLGLLLGGIPEVLVHPQRFRQRVSDALGSQQRAFITPQRAFTGAMLVTLLVVGLLFGLLVYQQTMFGGGIHTRGARMQPAAAGSEQGYLMTLDTGVSAERFFTRMLVEHQLGMVDRSVVGVFEQQSSVFEGAACSNGGGLENVRFPAPLGKAVKVRCTPRDALILSRLAEELSGRSVPALVKAKDGLSTDVVEFLQTHGSAVELLLILRFE